MTQNPLVEALEAGQRIFEIENARPYVGESAYVRDGGCPGCPRCAGNANKHRHRFGCLLLCVKCGIPHADFHADPQPCEPCDGNHSDAEQSLAFQTGGAL